MSTTKTSTSTADVQPSSGGPNSFWLLFALRRSLRLIVSLAALVVATFAMVAVTPGDPARASLGATASAEAVAQRRHELGLDQSFLTQFGDFVGKLFTGDLGSSFSLQLPVGELIAQRWSLTFELALLAFLAAATVAIPAGMLVAVITSGGQRPMVTAVFAGVTGIAFSIPGFLLAVALVYVFAVKLALLPIAGTDTLAGYVLPVAALAIGPAAAFARIVRLETTRVLHEDFVRTARAKRLPAKRIYLRHVFPNILTPTLSIGGLLLTGLLSGTVLVESIFALPGLGSTLTQAIGAKDYPLVQALALLFGGAVLVVNLVVDVLIALVDPRSAIREG